MSALLFMRTSGSCLASELQLNLLSLGGIPNVIGEYAFCTSFLITHCHIKVNQHLSQEVRRMVIS